MCVHLIESSMSETVGDACSAVVRIEDAKGTRCMWSGEKAKKEMYSYEVQNLGNEMVRSSCM